MGVTLERVQNKFACIIGELSSEPYILSQFAIWVDLRIAEYKSKGAISLDCDGDTPHPIWLKGLNPPTYSPTQSLAMEISSSWRPQEKEHFNRSVDENYPTSDTKIHENDVITIKDEGIENSGVFPMSLYRVERPEASNSNNSFTHSRKRLSSDRENLPSPSTLSSHTKVFSPRSDCKSRKTESHPDNQDLLSVIGLQNEDSTYEHQESETDSSLRYNNSYNTSFEDTSFQLNVETDGTAEGSLSTHTTVFQDFSSKNANSPRPVEIDNIATARHAVRGFHSSPPFHTKYWPTVESSANGKGIILDDNVLEEGMGTKPTESLTLEHCMSQTQEMNSVRPNSTQKNIKCAVRTLQNFLKDSGENRDVETIPPEALDDLLAHFFSTIKQRNGTDYHPNSLRSLRKFLISHLREHNYPYSITVSPAFGKSQFAFKNKYLQLVKNQCGTLN